MKPMLATARKLAICAAVFGAGAAVSGCVYPDLHLSDDYGRALRQDIVAQVANPEPAYTGVPAPGSAGSRVGSAQDRYHAGKVTQPASTSTSTVSAGGGGGGGGK
jgi:hypothetical protein